MIYIKEMQSLSKFNYLLISVLIKGALLWAP